MLDGPGNPARFFIGGDMSNNVTRLVVLHEAEQKEINADIVDRLERAIQRAKNGEFIGIAIIGIGQNGDNFVNYSRTGDRFKFLGGLEYVKFLAMKAYEQ